MLLEISSENGQSIAYPSRDYPKPNGEMHRKGKKLFFSWFAYKRYGYNVYGKDLSQYCRTINLLKQSLEIETLNYKTTLADATSSIVEQFGCY